MDFSLRIDLDLFRVVEFELYIDVLMIEEGGILQVDVFDWIQLDIFGMKFYKVKKEKWRWKKMLMLILDIYKQCEKNG